MSSPPRTGPLGAGAAEYPPRCFHPDGISIRLGTTALVGSTSHISPAGSRRCRSNGLDKLCAPVHRARLHFLRIRARFIRRHGLRGGGSHWSGDLQRKVATESLLAAAFPFRTARMVVAVVVLWEAAANASRRNADPLLEFSPRSNNPIPPRSGRAQS